MKTANLSLIENIGDCACNLIAAHLSLRLFGQDLSTETLGKLTSLVQSESRAGRPVRPPHEFILEVKRVISQKAWNQLSALLEKHPDSKNSQSENRLSVKEHAHLAMGLLWQTLLITECKQRHDEIRKEIATARVDST